MRNNYDDEDDDGYDPFDRVQEDEGEDAEEDAVPAPSHSTDPGVEVSMEIDEDGNELWHAKDSRIPGSSSIGHSLEEAVGGVEDRRHQFREILRKSRDERERREEEEHDR